MANSGLEPIRVATRSQLPLPKGSRLSDSDIASKDTATFKGDLLVDNLEQHTETGRQLNYPTLQALVEHQPES